MIHSRTSKIFKHLFRRFRFLQEISLTIQEHLKDVIQERDI